MYTDNKNYYIENMLPAKPIILSIVFLLLSEYLAAQYPVVVYDIGNQKQHIIVFPIRGEGKISDMGGYDQFFKTLEVWIYDYYGKEIYYNVQSIPVSEALADVVNKMMDREYTRFMMKQGQVISGMKAQPYPPNGY
ncbi:MAG: hypothetical protein NZ529_00635 [Cytophagaceae bacterium]|nr:hypothetical protein [Cytophagaceae bacterium]MDW8455270.1 hypothetical protein [Cytophagaceae bacterium]